MKRSEIILSLAPAFRDKFDFSSDEQFQKWADLTAKAAEPFVQLLADEEIAHRKTLEENKSLKAELAALKEVKK